ncbi:TPA: 2-hydroxyacyl-CoA dehydratase [Candidatus Poribacteria bacterium]|nr:2-hydroxyacyl-CoA dehydratase [Candidatus Poribacteria bacterium]
MTDYLQIWEDLGLDIDRHNTLLDILPGVYQDVYLSQENRPEGMKYFDFVVSEIHGLRVKELVEHKEKGGKVFGTFCVYVPDELIIAAGGAAVGLCGGTDFSIPAAEEILPRNLCPLIKSAFGFKVSRTCPYFEVADLVVGETTCDGKKKTWEIFGEHAPMYVMELPQCKEEGDKELWFHELYRFKDKVEEVTSNTITSENLIEAINIVDARRAALQRLFDLRKSDPTPISGLDALLISQIYFYDEPVRFTNQVNELCDELEERIQKGEGAFSKGTTRMLTAGTPMAIPHWKLHNIVEKSGAAIVCEESCVGTRSLTGETESKGDSLDDLLESIGERQFKINCACFTPNDERLDDIIDLAREYKIDGVIQYVLQFCQPFSIESVKVQQALEKAGIPSISIESDYSMEDVGQLQTRIEAFLEVVG